MLRVMYIDRVIFIIKMLGMLEILKKLKVNRPITYNYALIFILLTADDLRLVLAKPVLSL